MSWGSEIRAQVVLYRDTTPSAPRQARRRRQHPLELGGAFPKALPEQTGGGLYASPFLINDVSLVGVDRGER